MTQLGLRVRQARNEKGLDQKGLGLATGYSQGTISDIEAGRTAGPRKWHALADFLNISRDEFWALMELAREELGKTERLPAGARSSGSPHPHAEVPSISVAISPPSLVRDVPVMGRVRGGDDGRYIFNGEIIGWEVRPPELEGMKEVYATYIDGESMWPRYKPGETVWISPHQRAGRGDDVVVQLRGVDEYEPPYGFIKEFVRKTPTKLILLQYNPAKEVEYDLNEVVSIHPIVFSRRS